MKCLQILFPWFLLLCLMTRCLSQEEEFIYQLGDNISSVETHEETEEVEGIEIAAWNFDYVQGPLIITVFVIVAGIAKIGFHHAGILSSIFPESCSLIVLGSVVGGILYAMGAQHYLSFSAKTFFLLLLPPCVLESAYSLYDRTFIDNLGKILLYAVVGTLLNCFLIGPSLYACSLAGIMGASFEISLIECLVFSALIVAVDPVAVLAIFQEIHVNNVLYFLVFGESLLNDAVTIVLYNMMVAFVDMPTIPPSQIGYGVAAFFVVSIGGLIVGFVCGLFSAFMTKYTTQVRVVEPLAILAIAYLSYLLAELFEFSGIISIITCGLTQANYSFANISHKSHTTVKYFMKMLAATSESVIFMFLGLVLWSSEHVWNSGFVFLTIGFCLLFRFIVVLVLTFFVNKIEQIRIIDLVEQFIMAYGGLRGAVCFSLVILLDEQKIPLKNLMVTTTLAVIIFTVFVQGITIKPLVKCMRVELAKNHKVTMLEECNKNVVDFVMAGLEEINGHKGHNYIRLLLEHYDEKYFKKWLQKEPQTREVQIMQRFEKITLKEHLSSVEAVVHGMSGAVDELHKVESNLHKEVMMSSYHHPSFNETKDEILYEPEVEQLRKFFRKNPSQAIRYNKYDRNAIHDDSHDLHHHLQHRSHHLQRQRRLSHNFALSRTMSPTSSGLSSPSLSPKLHNSDHYCIEDDRWYNSASQNLYETSV